MNVNALVRSSLLSCSLSLLSMPAVAATAHPVDSTLKVPLAPAAAAQKLAAVQKKVRALAAAGKRPVAVFDIDDTLLHNGPFTPKALANTPEPGAVPFVRALSAAGATIVYLTGRNTSELAKTTAALKDAGLPLGADAHLMLNPDRKMKTVDWKRSATPAILKLGKPVAVFDNELANVRMFREAYPTSAVFRLATSSVKPDPGGNGPIFVIKDFLEAAAK